MLIIETNSDELHRNRGWILALGIILILLGIFALIDSVVASVVSMVVFGWILLISGVVEGFQTFRHRTGGHFFLHLLNALFSIVLGIMLLQNPLAGSLVITLLLASFFVVAGIFRIVAALAIQIPGSGWTLLNGFITVILGILVWLQWPKSGLWVIGMFIGINLIFSGWAQVMLALSLRRLAKESM
jgi:uncharacterized membrane protein HdeD (DUF308 family)